MEIIEPVEESEWVSPMEVQEKKVKGKIGIYVDLRNLNDECLHSPFPTPFADEVLENIGGYDAYSFTNGFSGYHQIIIAPEDRHKTTFSTSWISYQYKLMPFGLNNVPTIFSRILVAAFKEYIHKFLEVYFDYWTIFGLLKKQVASLRLMLDTRRQNQILLNLKKCIFCAPFGIFLGHVICKQGFMVDPAKIRIIVNLTTLKIVRQLCTMLGHTGYCKKFIKGYSLITASIEKLLKKDETFQWDPEELGCAERKYGNCADSSFLRLEERVSSAC